MPSALLVSSIMCVKARAWKNTAYTLRQAKLQIETTMHVPRKLVACVAGQRRAHSTDLTQPPTQPPTKQLLADDDLGSSSFTWRN